MRRLFVLQIFLLAFVPMLQAADYVLYSPDNNIKVSVRVDGAVSMGVEYLGVEYLRVPRMELVLGKQRLGTNVKVRNASRRQADRVLRPLYGINREVPERYRELQLDCRGNYSLIFRVYDEGVAWRFVTHAGKDTITVSDEMIDYQFADNHQVFFHPALSESDYRIQRIADRLAPNYTSMPVLVKPDDRVSILLHESDVFDYPCMSLTSNPDKANTLTALHAKCPKTVEPGGHKNFNLVVKETEDYLARTSGDRTFPWRIIAFAQHDKDLLANQLVYLLAPPDRLTGNSWIKPGKVAWDWWHALHLTGVSFRTGVNTETYKYYIDFAAKNGIEYVNLDEGWSNSFNLLEVSEGLDMEALASYARSRGVGLFLWCVWHTLDNQMAEALAQFEKWGIAGLKVDFMDRDDQLIVNFQERLLKEAARHKLLINFHGAYHPNGMERAYPNCVNIEGVRGLEADKMPGSGATPVTAVTIPFIRMFAGPMDYTPGAMTNRNKDDWRMIKANPMSQGTRCQQLAMYVVYYAPLQMLADAPTAYEKEPQYLKFLSAIPTVWDETVPLAGQVGEHVSVARRKDKTWFVGGMTNWNARSQELSLEFLDDAETYVAEIFTDGVNADKVGNDYAIAMREVRRSDRLQLDMAPGGGYAMRLTPKSARQEIVMLGDSHVQLGGDWNKRLGRTGVANAGFGGFTTSHFIWLVGPYVIEKHPRVCLLEGGINDIGSGIPLERTKRNYRSLVDSLLAHHIEVVMHAVTYPAEKDAETQQFKVGRVDSLNAFIHQLAASKGLPCIDLNPMLTEQKRLKKEYAADNVHFTPAAYAVWAEEINRVLREKGMQGEKTMK